MLSRPSDEVLEYFNAQMDAPLGGRRNLHWLVKCRQETLVLRRWAQPLEDIHYEMRILDRLAAMKWPVAPALAEPIELDGYFWSLAAFLPGSPRNEKADRDAQRQRGRLLAKLHADLMQLDGIGQRGRWRRCEEVLSDSTLDSVLQQYEGGRPEAARILRWHLEKARNRMVGIPLKNRPGMVIHGDFAPWNIHYLKGRLSGVLDFELAHWDHRIGDFALSWRGIYDDVIHGYNEVSPLDSDEWELLTPMWWAFLIEGACHDIRKGNLDPEWTIKQLLRRSPLMGADAMDFH